MADEQVVTVGNWTLVVEREGEGFLQITVYSNPPSAGQAPNQLLLPSRLMEKLSDLLAGFSSGAL